MSVQEVGPDFGGMSQEVFETGHKILDTAEGVDKSHQMELLAKVVPSLTYNALNSTKDLGEIDEAIWAISSSLQTLRQHKTSVELASIQQGYDDPDSR